MSDMAIDILLSATAFFGFLTVGCFVGTCFPTTSPGARYSPTIGAIIGIITAVVSYLWLSGHC